MKSKTVLPSAGVRATLLFVLVLGLSWLPAMGAEDEIVPEGRWLFILSHGSNTLDRSTSVDNESGPLLNYLVKDQSVRAEITGEVTRQETRTDLLLGYGISDTWNLVLDTTYWRIDQSSTAGTVSLDPDVTEQVSRLGNRSVSGLGRLTLTSLHRVSYSDQSGLIFGYGISAPLQGPNSPYAGRGTLYTGAPFNEYFGLFRYTYYMFTFPGRIDISGRVRVARKKNLETLSGSTATVHPGNIGEYALGWEQDFGGFHTAFEGAGYIQGMSSKDGTGEGNNVQRFTGRVRLGYGNLDQLQQTPLSFPFQVNLQYEKTLQGFNTIDYSSLSLIFLTYF